MPNIFEKIIILEDIWILNLWISKSVLRQGALTRFYSIITGQSSHKFFLKTVFRKNIYSSMYKFRFMSAFRKTLNEFFPRIQRLQLSMENRQKRMNEEIAGSLPLSSWQASNCMVWLAGSVESKAERPSGSLRGASLNCCLWLESYI